MVAYPNENKMVYGIVVGGNDKDPDPTCSGGARVYLPGEYGKDVNTQHLPFARNMAQGTQNGVMGSNNPAEHGTAVMCMKMPGHAGSGHLHILGTIPNDINRGGSTPGNSTGLWPAVEKAINDVTSIRIPPNIGSGTAGSKPPKEKGQYHSHSLLKGIPSTGTLWPMNGVTIPQMNNIATATQAFSGILSGDMLSMLPGMNMSLGGLLSGMGDKLLGELMSSLPPEIGAAMTSMSNLMRTVESAEGGGFSMAAKVNPATFFQSAANVIADSKTIYDLVGAFQRIQHDTSLYGLESLPAVNITMTGGPFGDIPSTIDALGNITSLLPDPVKALSDEFTSLMSNGAGFPGVFPGANMFGGSSQVLNDMFQRLKPEELTKATQQMQKAVAPGVDPRKAVNNMHKFATSAEKLGLKALKKVLS